MARRRLIDVEVVVHEALLDERPSRRKGSPANETKHCRAPRVPKKGSKPVLKGTKKYCDPVNVCGQRYRVMTDPVYDPHKWEGACTWQDNLIELLDQAEDRVHDSLLHELVHAITDACGLKWAIANRFKKLTASDRRALDEMLCRMLAPALLATLRDAGWLRLPRKSRHRRS